MSASHIIKRSLFSGVTFDTVKRLVDEQGFMKLTYGEIPVHVYSPELAYLFTLAEIPADEQRGKENVTVKSNPLIQAFVEGYGEGIKKFDELFKVSPTVLYGEHAKELIKDIHMNFYHIQHS